MQDNYERILLNLRIISKIPQNGRLKRMYHGVLSLEDEGYFVSLRRFINQDGRSQAIKDINSVLNEAINEIRSLSIGEDVDGEKIQTLYSTLAKAVTGIENLRTTYQNDVVTEARFDILIDKIHSQLGDIKKREEETNVF